MFDSIFKNIQFRNNKIKKNNDLRDLKDRGYLSFDEYSIMKDVAMYGEEATYSIISGYPKNTLAFMEYYKRGTDVELQSSLKDFWEGKTDSTDFFAERYKEYRTLRFSKISSSVKTEGSSDVEKPHATISRKIKQDSWGFVITNQFMSSIKKIDRKLQGRILLAMTEIRTHPTTSQGDTIKPLTADKKGFWRYRIGDYRLIYKPVEKLREILLISFAARGSVY